MSHEAHGHCAGQYRHRKASHLHTRQLGIALKIRFTVALTVRQRDPYLAELRTRGQRRDGRQRLRLSG